MFEYLVESRLHKMKAARLSLPSGEALLPTFMPVGTKASVKALTGDDLKGLGAQIVLGNTYHLYLRPGDELIKHMGGLGSFSGWNGPMLTDSGGFQVSSLGLFRKDLGKGGPKPPKITSKGVTFYSHLDGSEHWFDAEKSIQIQKNLGADVIMAFDEATPNKGKAYAKEAMGRTHAWLVRSVDEWKKKNKAGAQQALFGIVQGDRYKDLRRKSAEFVVSQDLPGVAIGGGSIGSNWEETAENVSWVYDLLPKNKPVYLMGVGVDPIDVISAVVEGADMFDCVAPTRMARTGLLYHGNIVFNGNFDKSKRFEVLASKKTGVGFESEFNRGRLHIGNMTFEKDAGPIMEGCDCYTCLSGFSRSYLRHLFKAHELTYHRLASIHNLRFMVRLCEELREYILSYGAKK